MYIHSVGAVATSREVRSTVWRRLLSPLIEPFFSKRPHRGIIERESFAVHSTSSSLFLYPDQVPHPTKAYLVKRRGATSLKKFRSRIGPPTGVGRRRDRVIYNKPHTPKSISLFFLFLLLYLSFSLPARPREGRTCQEKTKNKRGLRGWSALLSFPYNRATLFNSLYLSVMRSSFDYWV